MKPTTLGADRFVPPGAGIERLSEAAETCEGCPLFRDATQTVFGAGSDGGDPENARVVIVGDQPSDEDDRSGRPFSGPAGTLLVRALDQAGLERGDCYATNAVKHFKFVQLQPGGRRILKTPERSEVNACRPWLLAELDAIGPDLVITLGSVAAQSLMGPEFRVATHRGVLHELVHAGLAAPVTLLSTVHPGAILRLRESERKDAFAQMIVDLRKAAEFVGGHRAGSA